MAMSATMSVRKFIDQNRSIRRPEDALIDAGYHSVTTDKPGSYLSVRDIEDYTRNHVRAQEWCSEHFGHKHYCYNWGKWWFTHENDAILFKLTWT